MYNSLIKMFESVTQEHAHRDKMNQAECRCVVEDYWLKERNKPRD